MEDVIGSSGVKSTPCFRVYSAWILLFLGYVKSEITGQLYLSNGSHILKISSPNNEVTSIISTDIERPVGVAVDIEDRLLFWTDVGRKFRGIHRSNLDGSQPKHIIADVYMCNGVTVDWIANLIYWTDEVKSTIELADYHGNNRKTFIQDDISWPRGIVADPINGYLFWDDQKTQTVERSKLDGTDRRILIKQGLFWPNQLAISYTLRRIYWVDGYNETIGSCDFNGDNIDLVRNHRDSRDATPHFGIAVKNSAVYIGSTSDGAIFSGDLIEKSKPVKQEVKTLTSDEIRSLALVDTDVQPYKLHPCGQIERGGCSHLCLITGSATYSCGCPSHSALVPDEAKRRCVVPQQILIYAEKDKQRVMFVSLDFGRVTQPEMVGKSSVPVAVTYDPLHKTVYWSDVFDHKIYTVVLGTKKRASFLQSANGIGMVEGMSIDWRSRKLYFTNIGSSSPKVDGAAYNWQRVEMIGLDGKGRRTISTDVHRPRAIVVDMERNDLYFTDWGVQPRLIRTDLDGTNRVVLRDWDISNPNGLALSGDMLYMADSNYLSKSKAAQVTTYNVTSQEWHTLHGLDVQIPFGITVLNSSIYVTDWLSTSRNSGHLVEYNVESDSNKTIVKNVSNPSGVYFSATRMSLYPSNRLGCSRSFCSDLCVSSPEGATRKYKCLCPELSARVLTSDKKNCKVPTNFLLLTDLNTVKMVSLDRGTDRHPYTLHYGRYDSNFVGLVYDATYEKIYWSDLHRLVISSMYLNGTGLQIFAKTKMAVDAMALDAAHGKLYWTAYDREKGIIASKLLNSADQSYQVVMSHLDHPRAIVIDVKNRYIFWTEYGKKWRRPRVGRAHLDGSQNRTIASVGLQWPNALALYEGKLYLADGAHRRIDVMNLDGTNKKEVSHLTNSMTHIFGMTIYGDSLIYTDWMDNVTRMAHLKTGRRENLLSHLYRPAQVFLHHPTDLSASSSCLLDNGGCSDLCIPTPGGSHCACSPGRKLQPDQVTCVHAKNPWLPSDTFRCPHQCHRFGRCSHLISSTIYQCVCRPGYHGDGIKSCAECAVNHFKQHAGNETCTLCPSGSHTAGLTANRMCFCLKRNEVFTDGQCVGPSTTMKTTTPTPPTPVVTTESSLVPTTSQFDNIIHTMPTITDASSTKSGIPVFTNCPTQPVEIETAPDHDMAVLNLPLMAVDSQGHQLQIRGTQVTPPGVRLQWLAHGQNGYQHLSYTAVDLLGQIATCNFVVSVRDKEPPKFDICPEDIEVNTTFNSKEIHWKKPVATDNVKIINMKEPWQLPGSEFKTGSHLMEYVAEDGDMNMATCKFNITVTKIKITCKLPVGEPEHGALVCGHTLDGWMCHTFCDVRTHVLGGQQYHNFRCLATTGTWSAPFPKHYERRACVRRRRPVAGIIEVKFSFIGPCNPDDDLFKAKFVEQILRYMNEDGLCPPKSLNHVRDFCEKDAFKIHCHQSEEELNRVKRNGGQNRRSKGHMVQKSPERVSSVNVTWTAPVNVSNELNETAIQEILNRLLNGLKQNFNKKNVSVSIDNVVYHAKADSLRGDPVKWRCTKGDVLLQNTCVSCPVGTMHDEKSEKCVDCPADYYQNAEGQTQCKACPEATESPPGAHNRSQCVQMHSDGWSKDEIFIVVGTSCAFVILVLILALCLLYRRTSRMKSDITELRELKQVNPSNSYFTNDRVSTVRQEHLYDQNPSKKRLRARNNELQNVPSSIRMSPKNVNSERVDKTLDLENQINYCKERKILNIQQKPEKNLNLPQPEDSPPDGACGSISTEV